MMPNLGVRYGQGIAALAQNPELESLKELIEHTFSPLGFLKWLPESLFDAVTALTGSGPAFVYAMMNAMVEAAVLIGFPIETALELVEHMVGGSLATLNQSHKSLDELTKQLYTAAGTTIHGMEIFEAKGVTSGIIETFVAACRRAEQLGKTTN